MASTTQKYFLKLINQSGIVRTIEWAGGSENFEKIFPNPNKEQKIYFIKQFADDLDGIVLNDIGLEPIIYSEKEDEIHQIEYFGFNNVLVQVWGGYNMDTDLGEYHISYEKLGDDWIDKIYQALLDSFQVPSEIYETEKKKRRILNFKELFNNGIVYITKCHNLETGEPCEGTQLITLYNIKFPTKGQEFISKALEHPEPEAIGWWQKHQDQLTQDKYEQILKSMVIHEKSLLYESNLNEDVKLSNLPSTERYKIVAEKIIKLMDDKGITEIPGYRFLATLGKAEGLDYNMKSFLYSYLREGEYDSFVKPLIRNMRPEFTYPFISKVGQKKHIVDDTVVVYSIGEKIVYNTFKMNNIKLQYEDPKVRFNFVENGNIIRKKPDFYWPEKDMIIEVAGLSDQKAFGGNYLKKLKKAKKELESKGKKMIILDYYTYKNNPQGFYKYVCETFGFSYNPDDFWNAMKSVGYDESKYLETAKDLIMKGGSKTRGERDKMQKIITQILNKPRPTNDIKGSPSGYESVWDFKRETGIGLRWSDPELRKKVQQAWCKSTGSNLKTYEKFKELFPLESFSKTTVEIIKKKFPTEFDLKNKEQICEGQLSEQILRIRGNLKPYVTPIKQFFELFYESNKSAKRIKLFRQFFKKLNFDVENISEVQINSFFRYLKGEDSYNESGLDKEMMSRDLIFGFAYFIAKNQMSLKEGVEGLMYISDAGGVGINYYFFDQVLKIFVGGIGVSKSSLLKGNAYFVTNILIEEGLRGTGYAVRMYLTVMGEMDYLISDMTLYTGSYRIWAKVLPKYCNVWSYFTDGDKVKIKKITEDSNLDSSKIDRFIGSIYNKKVLVK